MEEFTQLLTSQSGLARIFVGLLSRNSNAGIVCVLWFSTNQCEREWP